MIEMVAHVLGHSLLVGRDAKLDVGLQGAPQVSRFAALENFGLAVEGVLAHGQPRELARRLVARVGLFDGAPTDSGRSPLGRARLLALRRVRALGVSRRPQRT